MADIIIKADKDVDLYLLWSSNIDSAVFVGSREQLTEYLLIKAKLDAEEKIRKDLTYADDAGTSSRIFGTGGWNDKYLHVSEDAPRDRVDGKYYIPRVKMLEYAQHLYLGDDEAAQKLLVFNSEY